MNNSTRKPSNSEFLLEMRNLRIEGQSKEKWQEPVDGDITPLLPAGAIALLAVGVNFVVDWFLHKTSGLRDEQ